MSPFVGGEMSWDGIQVASGVRSSRSCERWRRRTGMSPERTLNLVILTLVAVILVLIILMILGEIPSPF